MVFLLFMMGQLSFFFKVRAFYGSKGPTAHYKKRSSKKPEKHGTPAACPLRKTANCIIIPSKDKGVF